MAYFPNQGIDYFLFWIWLPLYIAMYTFVNTFITYNKAQYFDIFCFLTWTVVTIVLLQLWTSFESVKIGSVGAAAIIGTYYRFHDWGKWVIQWVLYLVLVVNIAEAVQEEYKLVRVSGVYALNPTVGALLIFTLPGPKTIERADLVVEEEDESSYTNCAGVRKIWYQFRKMMEGSQNVSADFSRAWIWSYTFWNIAFVLIALDESVFYSIWTLLFPIFYGRLLTPHKDALWLQYRTYNLSMTKLAVFISRQFPDSKIFVDYWFVQLDSRALFGIYCVNMILGILFLIWIFYRQYIVLFRVEDNGLMNFRTTMDTDTRQMSLYQWILSMIIMKYEEVHETAAGRMDSRMNSKDAELIPNESVTVTDLEHGRLSVGRDRMGSLDKVDEQTGGEVRNEEDGKDQFHE